MFLVAVAFLILIMACVLASPILALVVAACTMGAPGRARAIILAAIFPIVCIGWVVGVIFVNAAVNEVIFENDCGMGDSWWTKLPNGYRLLMIDETDHGTVYDPKHQDGAWISSEERGCFPGVRSLQIAGPYIAASVDRVESTRLGDYGPYIVIDTRTGNWSCHPDQDALAAAMAQLGYAANLSPILSVYSEHSNSAGVAGLIFLALLIFPPIVGFKWLCRYVGRVRARRLPA